MSDDVGVIIFAERAVRGVPGSIKNNPFHIWIQRTTATSMREGRATVIRRRRKKKMEK